MAKGTNDGVRKLSIKDQLPNCEILINRQLYDIQKIVANKKVIDIGCGFGRNKPIVENAGGVWVGVEPFEGGAETVIGNAENLPFENSSFDVAIMDAVLEHIPDVGKAFSEVSRVLRPGGIFIGYVAFMECFHEISYSHLSFKAIEHYSNINDMKLQKISGGTGFGVDYHLSVLFYPIPFKIGRRMIAKMIRTVIYIKSKLAYWGLRYRRKYSKELADSTSLEYYKLECLRMSYGFNFIIRKTNHTS